MPVALTILFLAKAAANAIQDSTDWGRILSKADPES
jgi:hypothetical protein